MSEKIYAKCVKFERWLEKNPGMGLVIVASLAFLDGLALDRLTRQKSLTIYHTYI